jgi:predicted nucleic acid-binding protein
MSFAEVSKRLANYILAGLGKVGQTIAFSSSQEAAEILADLGGWIIHRPGHADLLRAARFQRRYKMSWRDALVVTSAVELGCGVLWSEDLADGQRYESVTVRNPFV